MSLNEHSIAHTLSELERLGKLARLGFGQNVPTPTFSQPRPGYAIWRWSEMEPGERAIATLAYDDDDEASVLLTIVVGGDGVLKEVEAWRGDGRPVQHLKPAEEMSVVN